MRLADRYKDLKDLMKRLDHTNVKILTAMSRFGPRNLLEVSRRTGIPFTSVYHRVGKLEANTGRVAYLVPCVSRLGLLRMTVQATAKPGRETILARALEIPSWWQSTSHCETPFTNHSIYAVPVDSVNDFRKYFARLSHLGYTAQQRIIPTGDLQPNFPNFSYYNPVAKEWRFDWSRWISVVKKHRLTATIEDPRNYRTIIDERDLLIVRELQRNARATFADMSPLLGISLQGVKYHYDKKLVPSGVVRHFDYDIIPYPHDISAKHELLLTFPNKLAMNRFFSSLRELFFVQNSAKVLRNNSLLVTTYTPQSQLRNMFDFLSELAKARVLQTYSALRLIIDSEERQTTNPKLFTNQKGWLFDSRKYNAELSKLH